MTPCRFLLTGVGLLGVAILGRGQDREADARRIVGIWKVVSGEKQGTQEKDALGHRFVFGQEILTFEDARGKPVPPRTRYRLHPEKSPKEIDIIDAEGDGGKGGRAASLGIYELKGDRLRVCYALP